MILLVHFILLLLFLADHFNESFLMVSHFLSSAGTVLSLVLKLLSVYKDFAMTCKKIVILWTIFTVFWILIQLLLQFILANKLTLDLLSIFSHLFWFQEQLSHVHFVFNLRFVSLIRKILRLHEAFIPKRTLLETCLFLFLFLVSSHDVISFTVSTILTHIVPIIRCTSFINCVFILSLHISKLLKALRNTLLLVNNNNSCIILRKIVF